MIMRNLIKKETKRVRGLVQDEAQEIKGIMSRIKRRDLKGNSGQAIKNSSYQVAILLTGKMGSLLFTIILARLMLPEVYGLYSLALSTILFAAAFSDFGIQTTLITFLSKIIDKKPGKAKGYFYLLTKYKIFLTVSFAFALALSAGWISNSFYNKPIYYALLAGAIYLPSLILALYMTSIFISKNNFRPLLISEAILQILRLIIVPMLILFFLWDIPSVQIKLFAIFLALASCHLIKATYLIVVIKIKKPFRKSGIKNLNAGEKKEMFKFMLPLAVTVFSGIFFGLIDQIMLGHYVESSFLGLYQAAFNLVMAASAILAFSSSAAFPIFARLNTKRLEKAFKRTLKMVLLLSLISAAFVFVASPILISLIYGEEYLASIVYMRILTILLISFPLISLYVVYYNSQKRTLLNSVSLIISTIINIVLNYIFINIGLRYSMSYAVIGACLATIISRGIYLTILILSRKKSYPKEKIPKQEDSQKLFIR